jgi:hypothetical protein
MRPNVKTPPGAVASGKAGEVGNLEANSTKHGAIDIIQRRAASLRLQALGLIGGARRAPGMML